MKSIITDLSRRAFVERFVKTFLGVSLLPGLGALRGAGAARGTFGRLGAFGAPGAAGGAHCRAQCCASADGSRLTQERPSCLIRA